MQRDSTNNIAKEKRSESRRVKLRNYRIEIKFVGHPIYQFRVINVTAKGAGLLIKDDSAFLNMIEKGLVAYADKARKDASRNESERIVDWPTDLITTPFSRRQQTARTNEIRFWWKTKGDRDCMQKT